MIDGLIQAVLFSGVFFGALSKATYRASCIVTVNLCQSQSVSHSLIQSRPFSVSDILSQYLVVSVCLGPSGSFFVLVYFRLLKNSVEHANLLGGFLTVPT